MGTRAYRRWAVAIALSAAAHALILAGLMVRKARTQANAPTILVELVAPSPRTATRPTPSAQQAIRKVDDPPPPAPPIVRQPTPVMDAEPRPSAIEDPAGAPAGPGVRSPLYAGRPRPGLRRCDERGLTREEADRCNRMGLAVADRFAVPAGKVVPQSKMDPEKRAAFAAADEPNKPPVHFQTGVEYCSNNGCVISDAPAVIIGFTKKWKF